MSFGRASFQQDLMHRVYHQTVAASMNFLSITDRFLIVVFLEEPVPLREILNVLSFAPVAGFKEDPNP